MWIGQLVFTEFRRDDDRNESQNVNFFTYIRPITDRAFFLEIRDWGFIKPKVY